MCLFISSPVSPEIVADDELVVTDVIGCSPQAICESILVLGVDVGVDLHTEIVDMIASVDEEEGSKCSVDGEEEGKASPVSCVSASNPVEEEGRVRVSLHDKEEEGTVFSMPKKVQV